LARSSPPQLGGARIPATFAIRAGGALSPRTVAAPAGIAVQLTLISSDGRAHMVVVATAKPVTLHVPAGGQASTLLKQLSPATYRLEVDGKQRGSLIIGAAPGP
jgi:hypothetical protein